MKNFWKKAFLSIGILFTSTVMQAQVLQLSENPETFLGELNQIMAIGGNNVAMASGKTFENHWNKDFDASQKATMMALGHKMAVSGYKMPHFYQVLTIIDHCMVKEKYSNTQTLALMQMLQKVIETSDYKTGSNTLDVLKDFLEKRLLYSSNYNRLYAIGGEYGIRFLEKPTNYLEKQEVAITQPTDTPQKETSVFDSWDQPVSNNLSGEIETPSKPFVKKIHPLVSGLVIDLKDIDLVMATVSDSVVLKKTSGGAALKMGVFVGEGGKMTWESMKLPSIFVDLKDYSFELRNPRFSAEDVTLTYSDELLKPIQGVFEFRGGRRQAGVANTYPRFMSYNEDAVIKSISKAVEYKGGFSQGETSPDLPRGSWELSTSKKSCAQGLRGR